MANEGYARFLDEFRPRVNVLLARLRKAAGADDGPMSLGDLDILAAASMELLTSALANMPEPMRGKMVNKLSEIFAADVAEKRQRLEQKIPGRQLDARRVQREANLSLNRGVRFR
jgi:hypothetical protein